ncbi:unnamed protein product [Rotaria magnacalcarata]|uniref:Uncharacterized protein n=1 Tax=Rotaria magnacalcarata TaxID=392030 RepID=A0A816W6L4_9BILA|nr:unnamed protein product [Rotaria magnacalcarata]CAF2129268.1 unnamed protein product [Rotaria magnacalcarata]CAF3802880.1 unnamed protein product [Rotaria magnacalcarata]CAF3991488.1 unnamed protein product [Rotaria magnacalcarata]
MTHDGLRRLPPPPLFTIRPPPKPPGPLFEHFQTVEILNGQCVRPSLNIFNTSSTILQTHEEQINWLNLFLLILAIISVISCIIIAIFIFICLKKLRKEESQYKSYVMTGSISSRNPHPHQADLCSRASEHYKCTSTTLNCCDDYYSHQLIPMTEAPLQSVLSPHHSVNSTNNIDSPSALNSAGVVDNAQNHQYECIPECFLTMTRHHHHPSAACYRQHQLYHRPNTCSVPYATFSRSILLSRGVTTTSTSNSSQCTCSPPPSATIVQEESSIPLLDSSIYKESHRKGEQLPSPPKSMIIGWTRRNSTISTKRKSAGHSSNEQRHSFLSQLRKSSVLQ